jgi:hypothetical protein
MWVVIAGGIGGALLIRAYISKSQGSAATNPAPTSGTGQPGNIFFLPNTVAPAGVTLNVNPRSKPDYFNAQGQDLGQYRYGQDELTYLQQNIGNFGLTQAEVTDVDNAYAQVAQQYGQDTANALHYSWIGPGNVQGIPREPATSNQSYNGLP